MKRSGPSTGKTMLFACLLGSATAAVADPDATERWSLEDIVTVPEVTDIKLAGNGFAYYVVKVADISRDENRSELRRVKLADGTQTVLLNASSIKRLQKIPNGHDWSALLDVGRGQQLYRIQNNGQVQPLIENAHTVLVGTADQAVSSLDGEKPQEIGITSYDWSPDGQWLWYAKLRKNKHKEPIEFDDDVTKQRDQIRPPVQAFVDYFIRDANSKDWHVASRPTTDYFASRYGGRVRWGETSVKFRTASPDNAGGYSFQSFAWSLKDHILAPDSEQTADHATFAAWGPHGGVLSNEGLGKRRRIVEKVENGKNHNYGKADFTVGDPRAAGSFLARDGKRAIIGTRSLDKHSYGLAVADTASIRAIKSQGSLTECDFDNDLTKGVCIRQGLSEPPEIVALVPQSGNVTRIASVSQRHDKLLRLNASPRTWTNRLGYEATGFVILPSDHDKSKSYPTIFVTHGSDADERYASSDLQWNYPIQLLAQAGYVVILINDPSPFQEPRIFAAVQQLISGKGKLAPNEIQKLFWLNNVYSIEDAAREMAKEGIVDLSRVGIAGYSRGSQIVNVAVTQSKLFRAGSSGDGSHLEPLTYTISKSSFDMIFGGPPFGETFKNYQAISPSLRASTSCGAILSQMAATYPGQIDFHTALRDGGIPAQISHYPGETPQSDETHIFHIPSNRILAMKENLAWFDFWLLGQKSTLVESGRIDHWQAMADQWARKNCPAFGSASE